MGNKLSDGLVQHLQSGLVIPANPTALTINLKLDERRQRALSRYYLHAGSGGLAMGVHTSQFEIREAGLYMPVLELGKEEMDSFCDGNNKVLIRIAGVIGKTGQAVREAQIAYDLGYDAVLLSLAALKDVSNEKLIQHCRSVAEIIPLIGFYLQPTVGGRVLDVDFWREFATIENVVAIKMAPFDRYRTLDVVRGVVESGRADDIALYTGNDDNIVADLLTEFHIPTADVIIRKKIVGGLLGHWAVWNKKAVELLHIIKKSSPSQTKDLLSLGAKITDANAAFFDSRNGFKGSIAGIHEILIRQGFLEANHTLNPKEVLSPGQKEEIERVCNIYPELNDDDFVSANIDEWMR
ncbi:MAG: dihydrodipicolinate synthase family protein [Sediminicola sp.]|tara:strand:+ start:86098 stop:87153 length:1056 start_codon:yes stop_codon:yes gene_type:complete